MKSIVYNPVPFQELWLEYLSAEEIETEQSNATAEWDKLHFRASSPRPQVLPRNEEQHLGARIVKRIQSYDIPLKPLVLTEMTTPLIEINRETIMIQDTVYGLVKSWLDDVDSFTE